MGRILAHFFTALLAILVTWFYKEIAFEEELHMHYSRLGQNFEKASRNLDSLDRIMMKDFAQATHFNPTIYPSYEKAHKAEQLKEQFNKQITGLRREVERLMQVEANPNKRVQQMFIEEGRAKHLRQQINTTRNMLIDLIENDSVKTQTIKRSAFGATDFLHESWEEGTFGNVAAANAVTILVKINADCVAMYSDVLNEILGNLSDTKKQ